MASPTDTLPPLPRESDGFCLERELGRGGMGVVYQAIELASGRKVALKILSEDLAFSDEAFRRFRREARLAAGISDPRCVFVLGAHRVEGAPAISMELVDGGTLQHKIAAGEPISVDQAVRWTIDVIDGLTAAHAQGVLHRDIKPSNCFLDTDGRVKLGDFGLSRAIERDVNLTQSGQFIGSPLYASPEQVKGRGIDERSDQYSVGALLYALLTGRAPHTGNNVGEVLARIFSETPQAPSEVRSSVPRALDKVILRTLSREPDKRFRDLTGLRQALEPFIERDTPPEHLAGRVSAFVVDQAALALIGVLVGLSAERFLPGLFQALYGESSRWALAFQTVLGLGPTLVYYGTLEGAGGLTVGRWIVGSRVVDFQTRQPSYRGAYTRALLFFTPSALVGLISGLSGLESAGIWIMSTLTQLAWWIVLFQPARAHNGWRGRHERWSHTRTDQIRPPLLRTVSNSVPRQEVMDCAAPSILGAYVVQGCVHGQPHILEARDDELGRDVWMVRNSPPDLSTQRRSQARPARLRWLDTLSAGDDRYDVYEAPGGSAALHALPWLAQRNWTQRSRLALQLIDETLAGAAEPETTGLGPKRLWLDRQGNLRVLDTSVVPATSDAPPTQADSLSASLRLIYLGDQAHQHLPVDLPMHAEPAVRALLEPQPSQHTLHTARANLVRALEGAQRPSVRARVLQLLLGTVIPVLGLALLAIASIFAVMFTAGSSLGLRAQIAVRELRDQASTLTPAEIEDRQILVAEALQSPWNRALFWDDVLRTHAHEVTDAWQTRDPEAANPSPARIRSAHQRFQTTHPTLDPVEDDGLARLNQPAVLPALLAVCLLLWTLAAALSALITRGGLSYWIFGLRLRDRRGRPAARWLCAVRCVLGGSLPVLGLVAATWLVQGSHAWTGWALAACTGVACLTALVFAGARTSSTLVDKVLGTRIVPA